MTEKFEGIFQKLGKSSKPSRRLRHCKDGEIVLKIGSRDKVGIRARKSRACVCSESGLNHCRDHLNDLDFA